MAMTPSQRAALGARRCTHRYRFREKLDECGYDSTTLATELGVSPVTINRTINGSLHSPRVLSWFRDQGLAERFLCDPQKKINEIADPHAMLSK